MITNIHTSTQQTDCAINQNKLLEILKMAKVTKNDFISTFLTSVQTKAQECAEKAQAAQAQFEQTQDDDIKRIAQKNATHARFNTKLSEMSKEALSVAHTHNIDANKIVEQSRELKKRLIGALEAIAHSDKSKLDKALCAFLAELVANEKKSDFTVKQIQHAMNHGTPTQARYFKTWGELLGVASYDKPSQIVTVKRDSAFFKKLVALFD
jgi:hypothetical protein